MKKNLLKLNPAVLLGLVLMILLIWQCFPLAFAKDPSKSPQDEKTGPTQKSEPKSPLVQSDLASEKALILQSSAHSKS